MLGAIAASAAFDRTACCSEGREGARQPCWPSNRPDYRTERVAEARGATAVDESVLMTERLMARWEQGNDEAKPPSGSSRNANADNARHPSRASTSTTQSSGRIGRLQMIRKVLRAHLTLDYIPLALVLPPASPRSTRKRDPMTTPFFLRRIASGVAPALAALPLCVWAAPASAKCTPTQIGSPIFPSVADDSNVVTDSRAWRNLAIGDGHRRPVDHRRSGH